MKFAELSKLMTLDCKKGEIIWKAQKDGRDYYEFDHFDIRQDYYSKKP